MSKNRKGNSHEGHEDTKRRLGDLVLFLERILVGIDTSWEGEKKKLALA
jgi:hypothetical protein